MFVPTERLARTDEDSLLFGSPDVHGEASLNRLVEIAQQLLERISLRRTPGDDRDLGPISTFFRLVNDYLEFHGFPSLRSTSSKFSSFHLQGQARKRSSELMLRLSTTLIQEPPIHAYGRVYHNDGHLRLRDRKDTGPRTGTGPPFDTNAPFSVASNARSSGLLNNPFLLGRIPPSSVGFHPHRRGGRLRGTADALILSRRVSAVSKDGGSHLSGGRELSPSIRGFAATQGEAERRDEEGGLRAISRDAGGVSSRVAGPVRDERGANVGRSRTWAVHERPLHRSLE